MGTCRLSGGHSARDLSKVPSARNRAAIAPRTTRRLIPEHRFRDAEPAHGFVRATICPRGPALAAHPTQAPVREPRISLPRRSRSQTQSVSWRIRRVRRRIPSRAYRVPGPGTSTPRGWATVRSLTPHRSTNPSDLASLRLDRPLCLSRCTLASDWHGSWWKRRELPHLRSPSHHRHFLYAGHPCGEIRSNRPYPARFPFVHGALPAAHPTHSELRAGERSRARPEATREHRVLSYGPWRRSLGL
jgi:hypothetical protein